MTDIVERLLDGVIDLPRMGIKGVRASITADDLEEAAAEIERLRDLAHEQYAHADDLKARLAEAVEMLHRVYFASRIDVLMEGPRLSGWNRPELDRLWPELRDLVAKMEG